MAKIGRPSLLTPKTKRDLLEAIAAGSHYETACTYAGISYRTFSEWMQRGRGEHPARKADQEYAQFAQEVEAAEAKGEISAIAAIRGASKENWRAAAWLLENRHPDRWRKRDMDVLQAIKILVDAGIAPSEMIGITKTGIDEITQKLQAELGPKSDGSDPE